MKSVLLLFCFFLTGCSLLNKPKPQEVPIQVAANAPFPKRISTDITVKSVQFGIPDEQRNLVPTTSVPLLKNQAYGWLLEVDAAKTPMVVVREVHEAAKPSRVWASTPDSTITPDRRQMITEKVVDASSGFIQNFREVLDREPAGPRRIRVYVNDIFVTEFQFELRKTPL